MTVEQMLANQDAAYTVRGYEGIAWRFIEQETMMSFWVECEDCGDEESCCWDEEEEVFTGNVRMHMVGDDRGFIFDPDDCTIINDEAYCPECGQIGCTASGGSS
jgi:ribosomal protein S27E